MVDWKPRALDVQPGHLHMHLGRYVVDLLGPVGRRYQPGEHDRPGQCAPARRQRNLEERANRLVPVLRLALPFAMVWNVYTNVQANMAKYLMTT